MNQMIKVNVNVKYSDGKPEKQYSFYFKIETNNNQSDYLKNFLHELKFRTYWMPEAKIEKIDYRGLYGK